MHRKQQRKHTGKRSRRLHRSFAQNWSSGATRKFFALRMSSRGEKGGIKKPGKSPRETLKAHDGPQTDELKARIQSLESQLQSLNDQSDTLLSTEQDIRNRIRETRSQQEK